MIFYLIMGCISLFFLFSFIVLTIGFIKSLVCKDSEFKAGDLFLPMIIFAILTFLGFSIIYLANLTKNNMVEIRKITSENLDNILKISNFEFSAKQAHKFDKNAENNATCDDVKCVYSGSVSNKNGDMLSFTLLSSPQVYFDCTVSNNCKVNSYIEHGAKYLKITSN